MKKKNILLFALATTAIFSASAAKISDPVVMTINGKDVRQSEFEYLYQKNNLQQLAPQTLEEYVDMFVVYKLKVAEAEAEGIHQTDGFRKEFESYCSELSKPYLTDSLVGKRLIDEAYGRMATSRLVSHILVPLGRTYDEDMANRQRLDSIRTAIVNGKADFGEMAVRYSSDRSAVSNKGSMGYINVNRFPYPFEYAAYNTPVGQISQVVDDAPYGYHIIKVVDERPNPGKVEARHILKLTRGLSPEEAGVKKAQIDSIYKEIVNGGDFDAIARRESEDAGSAANGGMLGFFGQGEMVKEFEETAFGLKEGEVSAPFMTAYGYHIVQTLSHKGIGSLEEELPGIQSAISRDMRSTLPARQRLEELKATYGLTVDSTALFAVKAKMDLAKDVAEAVKSASGMTDVVARIAGKGITVSDVASYVAENSNGKATDGFILFNHGMNRLIDEATVKTARERLMEENSEYRNIVNEYRDGILLFEISNRNVWEKSTADVDGLNSYFNANRNKYTWDKPHYKGYVVFATSDSIAEAAKSYLAANSVENDSLINRMHDNFGRNVKIERVVTGKGDNGIVDNIAFNGSKPDAPGKWVAWFAYNGRVIDSPEEVSDVRGSVTSDYQQELEQNWVNGLRKKYDVKINKGVLKKIKDRKRD
ncbi:MAG: peptidylprolyl isomerase [Bacteroides sp.]|nr:peptidylprolyl isomerase [Bacteroides sp.]